LGFEKPEFTIRNFLRPPILPILEAFVRILTASSVKLHGSHRDLLKLGRLALGPGYLTPFPAGSPAAENAARPE